MSSLIRQWQLYHFATDFDRVLAQRVSTDIENSLFKYRVSYRHLTFMIETFELLMKSCEKFDLLFMHIQCATARSQLFQSNSRDILCEYSYKKSESLAQIHTTITEIQDFF